MATAYIGTALAGSFHIDAFDTGTFAPGAAAVLTDAAVSIALSPDSKTVYSLGGNSGIVSRFNTGLTLLNSVTLVGSAFQVIITSADGKRLYVSSRGNNTVYVLDSTTLATITTISVAVPFGLAVTPSDTFLYVVQQTPTQVAVFSIPSYTAVTTIPVGSAPTNAVMAYDGKTVYVANATAPSISVISTASNTVTATIPLAGGTIVLDLRISPDDKYVYAVDGFAAVAWQIATASNTVLATITTGSSAQHLAITPESSAVWFTENPPTTNQVEVDVIPTNAVFHTIAFTDPPGPIVITPTSLFKPSFPGGQFIPKLFIPQKGKVNVDYTPDELRANWMAMEVWSQRWLPPPTTALLFPHKNDATPEGINANWITLEVWGQVIKNLGAPYTPLFVPRKPSVKPEDLDIAFHSVENWANRLPL